ncbi:MAG: PIN domain-containing protein [Acidobacteria bacterium]|nr:PIN domain-containing protein [Acidobacteriota bacterium]
MIDTNVLIGALLRGAEPRRGSSLFRGPPQAARRSGAVSRVEDVLGRKALFKKAPLTARERPRFLEAFLSVCEWVQIYYLWRPNLRDEGGNHILELAVAGGAGMIVTDNLADFAGSDLRFPEIRVLSPRDLLKELA